MEQYLIFAEGQAMRRIPMHLQDWKAKPQEGGGNMKLTTRDTRLLEELRQQQAYAGKVLSISPFPSPY